MTRNQQWVILFLCLSLFLFFFLTTSLPPRNQAVLPPSAGDLNLKNAPGEELLVEVAGNVKRRGVYPIRPGQNILDVIEMAGGTQDPLSLPAESLLAPIQKNSRIRVLPDPEGKGTVRVEPLAPMTQKVLSVPIDINTAGVEELDTLPGIGPRTAQAIVSYREAHGEFNSPEDLLQVRGIGPKKLAVLLPRIAVKKRR